MKLSFNVIILMAILFSLMLYIPFVLYGCGDSQDADIGSIKGKLVDKSGNIMPGKKIKIVGINGVYGIGLLDTNVSGEFGFTNIPVGTYTLTAMNQDASFIASKNVDVPKDNTVNVTLQEGEVAPPTPTPAATNTPGGTVTVTPTFPDIFTPTPTLTPALF